VFPIGAVSIRFVRVRNKREMMRPKYRSLAVGKTPIVIDNSNIG
jgi:hypothetical protein